MGTIPNNTNDKPQNEIKINNIYNPEGLLFKEVLKNSIKNIITSGKISEKMLLSKQQIVIKNRAKEEDF